MTEDQLLPVRRAAADEGSGPILELLAERDRLIGAGAALDRARREILAMADGQDHFANPTLYAHLSDANREMFRHAARMLREAVARHLKPHPEAK